MAQVPRHRSRSKPRVQQKQISYTGMRDSKDPTSADPRKASYLQNVYAVLAEYGGGLEGRPGYSLVDVQLSGRTQLIYQFSELDGTEHTIVIVGGKFYEFDWATETFTEVLTTAQLTGAGVTLDTTNPVYATTFTDKMIVTDGVNKPWMWDGTSGAGITLLSNAPVAFGPPTVYYAKLFFVKDAERTTFVWSEENQPNTGYEAGGYTNAWTLGQTEQEPLFRLFGTNEALFYWRERSMGAIYGAVDENFQTTGTHEGVSKTIGTNAPASVVHHADSIYFMDADAHPQRYVIGAGFQEPPIWHDARETTLRLPRSNLPNVRGILRPLENSVTFAFTPVGQDENQQQLVYRADSGEFVSVWTNIQATEQALVKDADGDPIVLHGTSDGFIYKHGEPGGTIYSDNGVAITHKVWGSAMMWDAREEKYFSRIDASFRLESDLTNVGFTLSGPGCDAGTVLNPGTLSGSISIWGEAIWGTSVWSSGSVEAHLAIGLDCVSRWIQPRLSHDTLDEQFAFLGWSVIAQSAGSDPNIT